jgi:hypothetical protein
MALLASDFVSLARLPGAAYSVQQSTIGTTLRHVRKLLRKEKFLFGHGEIEVTVAVRTA